MDRDQLVRHLTEQPEAIYLVRHARNRARAAHLTRETIREAMIHCTDVVPSVEDRVNVLGRLTDGRAFRATTKFEGGRLVVITVTILGR